MCISAVFGPHSIHTENFHQNKSFNLKNFVESDLHSITEFFSKNHSLVYDLQNDQIKVSESFDQENAILLVQKVYEHFLSLCQEGQPSQNRAHLVSFAELLLTQLNDRHSRGEISNNALQKAIVKLDRLNVHIKTKYVDGLSPDNFPVLLNDDRNCLKNIASLYKTNLAQTDLEKWFSEKTSKGRENNTEDYILSPKGAALSYIFHPFSVDCVRELHLHRFISTFDESFSVDGSGDPMVRVDNQLTKISDILERFTISKDGSIYDKTKDNTEYFYFQNKGLIPGSPVLWEEGRLPVFKQVEPREKPLLQICTLIGPEVSSEGHAAIRLTGADGKIYSIGKFWHRDVELPGYTELFKTVPAMLRMDYHVYLPEENNLKTTDIDLTEEQFNDIYQYLVQLQSQYLQKNGGYNLLNENCSQLVVDVARRVNIFVDAQVSPFEYLLNIFNLDNSTIRHFIHRHQWVRDLSDIILYPIALIRNIFFAIIGAMSQSCEGNFKKSYAFKSLSDVFHPFSGRAVTPSAIRTWQELLS